MTATSYLAGAPEAIRAHDHITEHVAILPAFGEFLVDESGLVALHLPLRRGTQHGKRFRQASVGFAVSLYRINQLLQIDDVLSVRSP